MTIIIKGDEFTIDDAEAIASADEMLASLIEKHAIERIKEAQNQNKKVFDNENLRYVITVDNRKVYEGKDSLPPSGLLSRFISPTKAKAINRTITITIDFLFGINSRTKRRILRGVLNTALSHSGQLAFEIASIYNMDELRAVKIAHTVFKHTIGTPPPEEEDNEENVLRWIANELITRSPVFSGAYRDSHVLFIDQKPFCYASELLDGSIDEIPVADEYSFSNSVPYARKIEVGVTRTGRSFTINGEDRIYEHTALDADNMFADLAHITFEWRGNVNGLQVNQGLAARHVSPRRTAGGSIEARFDASNRGAHNRSENRFPTIIVRF